MAEGRCRRRRCRSPPRRGRSPPRTSRTSRLGDPLADVHGAARQRPQGVVGAAAAAGSRPRRWSPPRSRPARSSWAPARRGSFRIVGPGHRGPPAATSCSGSGYGCRPHRLEAGGVGVEQATRHEPPQVCHRRAVGVHAPNVGVNQETAAGLDAVAEVFLSSACPDCLTGRIAKRYPDLAADCGLLKQQVVGAAHCPHAHPPFDDVSVWPRTS